MRRKDSIFAYFSVVPSFAFLRGSANRRVLFVWAFACAVCFRWASFDGVVGGCVEVDDFSGSFVASTSVFAQDGSLDLSALDDSEASVAAPSSASVVPESKTPASTESSAVSANVASGSAASSTSASTSERTGFLKLILAGGWIGAILLIASILAVSLAIRLCLALRRSVFAPPALETELANRLIRGDFVGAFQTASESGSFLGRVAAAGLREADRGWNAVEKALEDAVSEETAALYRKTEPLATIGNVAPMLGLLGTVVGMVATFGELAVADAGGRNLASGIYFALVTTVDGLIVAIPVLVAHSLLNGRVAKLVAETVVKIDRAFAPVKRRAASDESFRSSVSRTSKEPQNAQLPQNTSSTSRPVACESVRRPTATPGLEEITSPRGSRPTLSLKPKRDD